MVRFALTPLAIAVALSPQFTFANEGIEVVEVSGTQVAGDTSVSSEELEKRQAQDLNDIFRSSSEVSVGGTSSVSQKVYVRGLEDTMLNVTVDGAEQSSSLFHHQGAISVEPELLKQVNVHSGTTRATDGAGALGGAIQFQTKDAQDLLKEGETFGALTKAGYYSNSNGYKTSANIYGKLSDDVGLLGSIAYLNSDNIEDGHGDEISYTESEQISALLKLSGYFNESHYLAASYEYRIDQGDRLNRPNWVESSRNLPLEQKTSRQTVKLNHGYHLSEKVNLDTTAYYNLNKIEHIDHPQWGSTEGQIDTYGFKLQNDSQLLSHHLYYGIDFKRDESEYYNAADGRYKENGDVIGLFLQNDWQITNQLLVTAGARYDWYSLTDSDDTEFDASGFSPNVGVNYTVIDDLDVFFSYAKAFRGQQVKEIFLIYAANDPNRKAEKATNIEAGFDYQFGNFSTGFTYFDTQIKDVVGYDYTSFTNLGELTNQGFDAYVSYMNSAFSSRLSYGQSSPEIDGVPLSDDNTNIGTSMGHKWVLDLSYKLTPSLDFGWTSTFVERFTDVADDSANPEKPGYGVHDLYTQWAPETVDSLTLTFTVKNVFDKYYHDHASYASYIGSPIAIGTASAGRDFRFNLAYSF